MNIGDYVYVIQFNLFGWIVKVAETITVKVEGDDTLHCVCDIKHVRKAQR